MSNFWPSGLDLNDTRTPRTILDDANEEWVISSAGMMELVLQDTESESGNSMIIVHAKHISTNRTATLFSIVHRPNKPYPVTIEVDNEDLPVFLKKSYSRSNFLTTAAESIGRGESVSNPWVSDTPSEFRKKLAEAFNLGSVITKIQNLVSSTSVDTNGESQEGLEEN